MSDLDTMLTELRDDLNSSLTPPDLAHVTGRARARAVRRRMQIGAVVAVVAVSAAVPLLRSLPDNRQPAKPPVPASMTFEVDFADADHAYAMGSDCEDTEEDMCELALFASADGGRSWEERTLPDGDQLYSMGYATVLGADRVTVDRVSTGDKQYLGRIISDDAGRTWRTTELSGLSAPAPIPDGAWLQSACVATIGDRSCLQGVGAVSEDGTHAVPAPVQPPLVELTVGRTATPSGRYWATGVDRTTGSWAISVTANGGSSWWTTQLSVPGEPALNDAWAVVESDDVMYATLQGSIAKGPYGLLAVYRSTDGGETWTNTWRATPETVLQAALGVPVATSDGRLLVYSAATGTYESRGGGAFTKSAGQLPGEVMWTRGGYVAKTKDGFAISTDGNEWRNFTIG